VSEVRKIRAIDDWPSNAELIADAAALGYIEGDVLDTTYGEGVFWKVFTPERLVRSDRFKATGDLRADATMLPFRDRSFRTVVVDLPYKLSGTPRLGVTDYRYGTDRRTTRDDVRDVLVRAAVEGYRVTRRWLLVKVQDQVEGGQMRWQTDWIKEGLDPLGARKVDRFDYPTKGIPQPSTRKCPDCDGSGVDVEQMAANTRVVACARCAGTMVVPIVQQTARHDYSQLLVYRKPGRA
jgi:hypothetical protein